MKKHNVGDVVKVVNLPYGMNHFGHIGQLGVITKFDSSGRNFFLDFGRKDICGWWMSSNVVGIDRMTESVHSPEDAITSESATLDLMEIMERLSKDIQNKKEMLDSLIYEYNCSVKRNEKKNAKTDSV